MEGQIANSSTSVEMVVGVQQLVEEFQDLAIHDQSKNDGKCIVAMEETNQGVCGSNNTDNSDHHGVCAICLKKIVLQETALVKGCEHAYCVTCILRWASYKKEPTCPQCKHPFEFLNVHRSLDGSINDFMFEESVCLLLLAPWYTPVVITEPEAPEEEIEDYYYFYEDENDDLDEVYLGSSSNIRIGNRRWGDNGYVRAGRQEARPIHHRPSLQDSAEGPSRQPKKKETVAKELVGRRAKRALKREAADKAAAAKHQQHLARLGRLK